ncbi:MAG: ornithine cyclodeaminase family protein [Ilumatobacteraceae bacterium]
MVEFIDADRVRRGLPWPELVEALRIGFARGDVTAPRRHHHELGPADDPDTPTMLLMPAWNREFAGVKVAGVFPTNRARGQDSVQASYLLTSATDGTPLALIEGGELTARRTVAASVLAATYLARAASSRLLIVGAGRIAANVAEAYSSAFPIEEILVWNHHPVGAARLAARLRDDGHQAEATDDLAAACDRADIVSAATLATDPVIRGDWLRPGTHVDLIGGFTPAMREADDAAVRRSIVYVDTLDGALAEAGDIVQPLESGTITEDDIAGDLTGLARGTAAPRTDDDAITLFKSVGHALEDLVAAATLYEAC